MKDELNWGYIWILLHTSILVLTLSYFYLNGELMLYKERIAWVYLSFLLLPYFLKKFKQRKYVQKRTIVIQILKE